MRAVTYLLQADRRAGLAGPPPLAVDLLLDGSGAARHHDGAGAYGFLDPIGPNEGQEFVDLDLGSGHLDDDRLRREIHDPALRKLDELQDLGAIAVGRADLD